MSLEKLAIAWQQAKDEETRATEQRRLIEDQMAKELRIESTLDGTMNATIQGYKIKVVGRMNQKVDSAKLQELAAEYGLTDALSTLFRWKPEINATIWKATDSSITKPLLAAITTTPGRPSFSITKEQ